MTTKKTIRPVSVFYSWEAEDTGESYSVDIPGVIDSESHVEELKSEKLMKYTFIVIANPRETPIENRDDTTSAPTEEIYPDIRKLTYDEPIFDPQQIHKFRKETLQVLKDYGYTVMHTTEYDRMIKRLDALETLQHELEKID